MTAVAPCDACSGSFHVAVSATAGTCETTSVGVLFVGSGAGFSATFISGAGAGTALAAASLKVT